MGGFGNSGDVLRRHIGKESFIAGAHDPTRAEKILKPPHLVLDPVRRGVYEKLLRVDAAEKSDELGTIDEQSEKMETTRFSVVDGHGNAVSITYTLNRDFGAYLVPAGSGVVLNNSLSDFSNKVKPGGFGRANLPAPGKRPLSSMTPTIIAKNSKPY